MCYFSKDIFLHFKFVIFKIIYLLFFSKRHGATEVRADEGGASSGATGRNPSVYGTGYRLGTGNEPQEVVQGPPRPKQPVIFKKKNFKFS